MATRLIVLVMACGLVAGATDDRTAPPFDHAATQTERVTLDAVLAAYVSGDTDVVSRSFVRSRDFPDRLKLNDPEEFERWLKTWDRRKALLLLEIARVTSNVSPRFPGVVVDAGRRYLLTAGKAEMVSEGAALIHLWHRIAAAFLQNFSDPLRLEEYVRDVGARTGSPLDPRLVLARAVAQERRCWEMRPSLDRPDHRTAALVKSAGVEITPDLDSPRPGLLAASLAAHKACLVEALARFEVAATMDDSRAEARVRGGWILFQLERFAESLDWLNVTVPAGDRPLAYWHALFRGRTLDSLGRFQDALSAYQTATTLYPSAQSAGIGLAMALVRLERDAEADTVARKLRVSTAGAVDPWTTYLAGDYRFLDRWIDQMRVAWR